MKHPFQDNGIEYRSQQMMMIFNGGGLDGEKFYSVLKPDGVGCYVSDQRPGEFKQVFVPLDFTSQEMIG